MKVLLAQVYCIYLPTVRLVNFEGVNIFADLWVIEQHENWNP